MSSKTALAIALAALVPSTALAAETYTIDAAHSALIFAAKHFGAGYTYGHFNDFSGTFTVDKANPAATKVHLEIKAPSIDTENAKRDDHLRSPDFFNAAQFPTLTFDATKVVAKDADTVVVAGNLTMHGTTKAVAFDFDWTGEGDDPWGNHRMGGRGTLKIKRSDWGVVGLKDAVGDEVELTIAIEGTRPK